MRKERIKVTVDESGQVIWTRGGSGISVKEFIEKYPCEALKSLRSNGTFTDFGQAIVGAIGGLGNLVEFNKLHNCGEDDSNLNQI